MYKFKPNALAEILGLPEVSNEDFVSLRLELCRVQPKLSGLLVDQYPFGVGKNTGDLKMLVDTNIDCAHVTRENVNRLFAVIGTVSRLG